MVVELSRIKLDSLHKIKHKLSAHGHNSLDCHLCVDVKDSIENQRTYLLRPSK